MFCLLLIAALLVIVRPGRLVILVIQVLSLSLSLSFCPIPQCLSKFSLPMPDALPQGLIRELPSADGYDKTAPVEEPSPDMDDLDELKKQLEALNAA